MNLNQELNIARNIILNSKLTDGFSGANLLCEIYCHNSIHYPTFFAQIYSHNNRYYFVYVKTFFVDYWGIKTSSETFENTQKASLHPAKAGNYVCGLKLLHANDLNLTKIISILPSKTEHETPSGLVLDGQFTYIINFLNENPVEISFFNANSLKTNLLNDVQTNILENISLIFCEITK